MMITIIAFPKGVTTVELGRNASNKERRRHTLYIGQVKIVENNQPFQVP